MAMNPKDLLVWIKSLSRGQALPLDASEVHESFEDAQEYANTAIAYGGQTVKVKRDDGKYHEYILQPSEDGYRLEEIIGGGSAGIHVGDESSMPEGTVMHIDPEGEGYEMLELDTTLSKAGAAADAKAVGDVLIKKLDADRLNGAVEDVLRQAKESGEFDGEPGAPGTTPHIGENGNWHVGETDTGVRAQGNPGKDANVTSENIKSALGYTPANETDVDSLSKAIDNKVSSTEVKSILVMTQAEYDAISEKDATTLYIVTDATNTDDETETPSDVVPYLLNDGAVYVDTEYIETLNDTYELTIRDAGIDGAYGSSTTKYCGTHYNNIAYAGSKYISALHGQKYIGYKPDNLGKKMVVKRSPTTMYYNGEVVGTADVGGTIGRYSFILFGGRYLDLAEACTHTIYFFGLKIWQGDELVHNYIPAQDDSGEACVYDTVNKKYFYGVGGTLTYGEELEES